MPGSGGIFYHFFTYLFGFRTLVEFDDPEVANITCKPSSTFSISHSTRIISSVFFSPSRLTYPLFPFHCLSLHSVLCSTYARVLATFFSLYNRCMLTIPHIYHIILLDGLPSFTNVG